MKNFIETLNIFDLSEDRKISLNSFLKKNLKTELKNLQKIFIKNDKTIYLYPLEYFFKFPKFIKNSEYKENNLFFSLYLPAEITEKNKKEIKKINFFICNFPLITNNNSYIINGIEKVIHQQITFDPSFLLEKRNNILTASIYNDTFDKQVQIFFDSNKNNKYHLNNLGNNITKFIIDNLPKNIKNSESKIEEIKKLLKLFQENNIYNSLIQDNFNNFFKLLKINKKIRYKLNKKLDLKIPNNLLYITKLDIEKIIKKLSDIENKINDVDNLDNIKNKSIKDLKDYYLNILKRGLSNFIFSFDNNKYFNTKKLLKNIKNSSISTSIDEFFFNSDISLIIDQTNPISELTQQKKVLNLKRQSGNKNVSLNIRNINPSIFGRLCVIETPEGESSGLINNLTFLSLINKFGFIETPIQNINNNNDFIIYDKTKFIDSEDEKLFFINFEINKLNYYTTKKRTNIKILENLIEKKNNKIKKSFLSYLQIFSIACSNIPFLEHNDGNRVLMGANMQKQAVPLLLTENPIVNSGIEDILAYSSNSIKSLTNGFIFFVNSSKIIIKTKRNKKLIYFLDKLKPTFNETVINHKINKWPGEKINFGEILASGFSINNAEISLGTNLTIAYMNWEGLNFEDAIIINDKLIKEDKLTSLHIKTVYIDLNNNEKLHFIKKNETKTEKDNNLTKFSIIKKGIFLNKGDTILIKEEKKKTLKKEKKYIFIESDFSGFVLNIELFDKNNFISDLQNKEVGKQLIKIQILQYKKIKVGDKLSGRFGNKGVISKIVADQDMPFLLDGTSIDILLNPLGIPSRMNIGQIFETLLGLIGTVNKKHFKILSFDESFGKNATRILVNQKLKEQKKNLNKTFLLSNDNSEKNYIIDGRNGEILDNPILIGRSYILKLYHLVDDKITARSIGPTNLITNQPVKGKKLGGGQRFGEMEVWALEAYGASFTLYEMLNLKSDDTMVSNNILEKLNQDIIPDLVNYSQSLLVFDIDLKSLGFDLSISIKDFNNSKNYQKNISDFYKKKDLTIEAKNLLNKIYVNSKI